VSFSNLRYWIYRLRKDTRPLVTEPAKLSDQAPAKVPAPDGSRLLPVRVVASASKTRTRAMVMAAGDELLERMPWDEATRRRKDKPPLVGRLRHFRSPATRTK
jgi:hypothetical protein